VSPSSLKGHFVDGDYSTLEGQRKRDQGQEK